MSSSPRRSPVVLDARLDDEKLAELLAHGTEYPDLDLKQKVDPTTTEGLVELALDVGAMQVGGGYILAGFDGQRRPVDDLQDVDPRSFDEARLRPRLLKYLPEPLDLLTRVIERDGHRAVLIYVGRHPSGCAIFRADGQYKKGGELVVRFRAGEVFWRNGTSSERISQQGFEEIMERRIAEEKTRWLDEQQETRRREQADREAAVEARSVARSSSLGAINLDLEPAALVATALELLRAGDQIALRHLFNEALRRARSAIERDELDTELADVVDKLACLAAAFLEYEQQEPFEAVVDTLGRIYSEGFRGEHPDRFDLPATISPTEVGPRVWLLIIERVYGLGALAVRLRNWEAVKALALQLPRGVDDSYGGWLRHALTMASRAQHLEEQQGDRTVEVNLLSRAQAVVEESDCLRADGGGGDEVITSLAGFDLLAGVAAIGATGKADDYAFYPNFAQFRQSRIQLLADALVADDEMRQALFPGTDEQLAIALRFVEAYAHRVGLRFDGFDAWRYTPVGDFVEQHLPPDYPAPGGF